MRDSCNRDREISVHVQFPCLVRKRRVQNLELMLKTCLTRFLRRGNIDFDAINGGIKGGKRGKKRKKQKEKKKGEKEERSIEASSLISSVDTGRFLRCPCSTTLIAPPRECLMNL